MGDPLLLTGAVHLNATCVKFEFVSSLIKAVGGSGIVAARIGSTELSILLPTMLIAATLKLYVVPATNPVTIKDIPENAAFFVT
jgi:hypothetical protein